MKFSKKLLQNLFLSYIIIGQYENRHIVYNATKICIVIVQVEQKLR
jgi:hypothetical protein